MDNILAALHLKVWEEDGHVPGHVDNTSNSDHISLRQLHQVGKLSSGSYSVNGLVGFLSHNLVSGRGHVKELVGIHTLGLHKKNELSFVWFILQLNSGNVKVSVCVGDLYLNVASSIQFDIIVLFLNIYSCRPDR